MFKNFVCGRFKHKTKTQTTHVEKSKAAFSDASSTLAVSTKLLGKLLNLLKRKEIKMLEVLLNVLAVIGIIVVGGFVVVFLGNLLLNVLDSESRSKKDKEQQVEPVQPEQITYQAQPQPEQLNYIEPEPQAQEYTDVDLAKAKEEEEALNGQSLDEAYAKLRAEEEAFRQERAKFIEEQKRAEEEKQVSEVDDQQAQETDSDDDIDLDDIFFDEDEEIVEEPKEEDTTAEDDVDAAVEEDDHHDEENEQVEEQEPVEEETENLDDERIKELEAELERQKAELEEYKRRAETAEDKLQEEATEPVSDANLSLEEYEARLETLTQRLKDNDKQLKAVKKEYLPLARVRKSLENDKKKLRRREALVAKQKVVLYGVNNYGDIDEEKAKKLAEDLDLLDGLKVSVQHCEEVLAQNKERLPILENTYNILLENSNNLKGDIEETKAKIEELKKPEGEGDVDSSTDAE